MKTLQCKPTIKSIFNELLNHPDYKSIQNDPNAFSLDALGLESPIWIPDTIKAVVYLKEVISKKGSVLVIGDRDVDGVSSTALLGNFLQQELVNKGGQLQLIVSDDGDDYGLSGKVFEKAMNSKCDLLVLLDMGSSNGPEIKELAKTKNIIILDHHQLHDRLPDEKICAFVNPMRFEDKNKFSHEGKMATAGIVFKVLLAYAFSFTNEWDRIYKIPETNKDIFHYYRLGMYLGTTEPESENNIKQTNDVTKLVELLPGNHNNINFLHLNKQEWQRLFEKPELAGTLFVVGSIRSRLRLQKFIIEISRLASLGLITDMVPLNGENRTMVKLGFMRNCQDIELNKQSQINAGLDSLINKIKLAPGPMNSKDIGWNIGPLINAAGRMGNTQLALDVLTAKDENIATDLTAKLIQLNVLRKKRTAKNEEIVVELFKKYPEKLEQKIVFCHHPDLQKGVSGIVATRLTEKYKKPVIYINHENDKMAKGSARTWGGINVLHLIDTCSDLFEQFGGHPEAAGFSLKIDNITEFESRIIEASKNEFQQIENQKQCDFHIRLPLELLNPEFFMHLDQLEPYGTKNPEPKILLKEVVPDKIKMMSNGIHLKFTGKKISRSIDFVIWNKAQDFIQQLETSGNLDLIGSLEKNYFAGRTRLQFRIDSYGDDF